MKWLTAVESVYPKAHSAVVATSLPHAKMLAVSTNVSLLCLLTIYLDIFVFAQTDICTDPVEIFQYMHSQQLCSGLALFFESWAQLQENLGNYKKADEVFMLGIQNNAQPLDRLRKQHRSVYVAMIPK